MRRLFCCGRRKSMGYFADFVLFFPLTFSYNSSKEEVEAHDTEREDFGTAALGKAGAQT